MRDALTAIPAFSIFSASSELLVTAAVFYVLWRAYFHGDLRWGLLWVTLGFEAAVNITYMAYRIAVPSHAAADAPAWMTAVQGAHGILSLVMFIGLILLAGMARAVHRDGRNFFRESPALTLSFVVLWIASVASGEFIFVATYLA